MKIAQSHGGRTVLDIPGTIMIMIMIIIITLFMIIIFIILFTIMLLQ